MDIKVPKAQAAATATATVPWTRRKPQRKRSTNMCCNQIRDICILRAISFFEGRVDPALQHSISDTSQVHGIGQRAGLGFFVSGAHPPLAIGVVIVCMLFFSVCA